MFTFLNSLLADLIFSNPSQLGTHEFSFLSNNFVAATKLNERKFPHLQILQWKMNLNDGQMHETLGCNEDSYEIIAE
jgi:hypothetical protein